MPTPSKSIGESIVGPDIITVAIFAHRQADRTTFARAIFLKQHTAVFHDRLHTFSFK